MLLAHCMDSLLRCGPALRSRSSIGFHSCLCSCPCLFPCFVCPCHCANRVCCLGALFVTFLGSVISPATRQFISSFSTMPCSRSVWPLFCLFLCQSCTPSKRWHTRLRMTCRCSNPGHSVLSSRCTQQHYPGSLVSVHHRTSFR